MSPDIKSMILDKAKDRFDRFGYKKTTMDEICRDCKISKKTLYELFSDKENLFHCLFLREGQKVQEIIFTSTAAISDPVERLKQLIRRAVLFFSEENFLTRLLRDDEAIFSAFLSKKYNNEIEKSSLALLVEIIEEGKRLGVIREVDSYVVAYAGLKLCHAFSFMKTIEFDKQREEQGYYAEVLVDFIMNGLVK